MGNKVWQTCHEWCLEHGVNITDLPEEQYHYYSTEKVSKVVFDDFILAYNIEQGITQKPEKYLELRMYGLVPYNLSPIQAGIQFDHACKRYGREYFNDEDYQSYIHEWETDIVLNGGTSNEGHWVRHGFKDEWYVGSMQQHLEDLTEADIKLAVFHEPDLNSMLTGIVFLVDERVFNKRVYLDFDVWMRKLGCVDDIITPDMHPEQYKEWVKIIGGEKNVFLRDFLSKFRLANN
jgi:hypothetical protein